MKMCWHYCWTTQSFKTLQLGYRLCVRIAIDARLMRFRRPNGLMQKQQDQISNRKSRLCALSSQNEEEATKSCKDITWSEVTRSNGLNADYPMVNLSSQPTLKVRSDLLAGEPNVLPVWKLYEKAEQEDRRY